MPQFGKYKPMSELAVHMAMKVCDGLHDAHTRHKPDGRPLKLVHRDVSPPGRAVVAWMRFTPGIANKLAPVAP